jgi:hypothetical protein
MMNSSMQKNFLILYDGREGSSAIISMLSAQNGVCVPVFEDLDKRDFVVNHPGESLADVIDDVYLSGRYDAVDTAESRRDLFPPGDCPIQSIGFKARLFGDMKSIAPVLKARNVTVFALFRRKFDDMVSSLYLQQHASASLPENGRVPKKIKFNQIAPSALTRRNTPQFQLLGMNAEEKRAFLEQYNRISIPVDPTSFSRLAKRITGNRHRVLRDASILAEQGVKIVPIAYEDFVVDRVAFVRKMLNQLGFSPDWPILDRTKFNKVNDKSATTKLRFTLLHPAWALYWHHRRSYGRCLTKLAKLGEQSTG